MSNRADRTLVYIDTETHAKLKQLAPEYDCTIVELIRELVETEYRKKF